MKAITCTFNGHRYPIFKEVSDAEHKLVLAKMTKLDELGRKWDQLEKEQTRLMEQQTDEATVKLAEIDVAIYEVSDQTERITNELEAAMESTLKNCLGLSPAEIVNIEKDERINIFLQLAERVRL